MNGEDYSYARYMAARKYAVLAVDLPGAGESDKPSGPDLRLADIGEAVRQVIEALRSGTVLVGHSAGSIAATFAQANWHPADALVVTASRHLVGEMLTLPVTQAILPLLLELVKALAGVPYLSLPSDARTALFYYPPAADPDVIALDNATADQWTNGQLLTTFFAFLNPSIDQVGHVTGPVLIQLGTHDVLFPAALPDVERALWTSTSPDIQTLTGIGHDFNLHLNHADGWRGIDDWLSTSPGNSRCRRRRSSGGHGSTLADYGVTRTGPGGAVGGAHRRSVRRVKRPSRHRLRAVGRWDPLGWG